jgi:predicted nucleic acid-binding Zn ribbon protein
MATYVYETIPANAAETPRRFEVQQKMSDPALTTDPQTGDPFGGLSRAAAGW